MHRYVPLNDSSTSDSCAQNLGHIFHFAVLCHAHRQMRAERKCQHCVLQMILVAGARLAFFSISSRRELCFWLFR
jgi:hypothetical protein